MASVKRELTWFKPAQCWKKFRRGKVYYLGKGKCQNKGDADGYNAALEEWHAKLAELEQAERLATNGYAHAVGFTDYAAMRHLLPGMAPAAGPVETQLAALIQTYLAQKRQESDAGQIALKTYLESKHKLDDFSQFALADGRTDVNEIDETFLDAYRGAQLSLTTKPKAKRERTAEGKLLALATFGISAATAKKRLQVLKRFLEFCYRRGALARLPRNLDRTFCKVKLPPPKPLHYSPDEIRTLFAAAIPRTQLFIALALNFGFTQSDVSSLTFDMIDREKGELKRQRGKTGTEQRSRIWPITLRLLDRFATVRDDKQPGGGLMLMGEHGKPLVHSRLNDSDMLAATDSIKLAFNRLRQKLGMQDERTFKTLRKTGAEMLSANWPPHVRDMYLAHTPKNRVAGHYSKSSDWAALFEAQDWLATQLRLGE